MAQLHGCAMPIGKFFGSAYRLDARAQGVVRVHVWGQTVTSVDHTEARCGQSGAGSPRVPGGVPHRPRPSHLCPIGPATRSGGRREEYPALSRHRLAIREATEDRLAAPTSGGPDPTVRFSVVHGLHDEACHSGEILLLRKMQGLGRPPRVSC